jgi:glycosyltransferase involved in cell wall biosynthesis
MSARGPARIALVFDGDPRDRNLWSGTPYGVLHGLRAAGVEVHLVDCSLPPRLRDSLSLALAPPLLRHAHGGGPKDRLRSAYRAARIGPYVARAQTAVASRGFRRLPPLDGIVQIGTGYRVPRVAPIVTYEDMTIVQALRYPFRHWGTMPQGHIDRRVALQRRCYADAHAQALMSTWAAGSVHEDYGVPTDRIVVAGVGSHDPRRVVERDWAAPRFLFVGFDWERKNGPRVLDAFARVRSRHPEATLDLVGGHPQIDQPGVTGHGVVRRDAAGGDLRIRELFDRATCFVMPSRFEPAGIVYNEAMACGLPIVGSTSGGARTLIGDAGIVVDPDDTAAIENAMTTLADPDTAERVGALAAARAPLFTWDAVAERLLGAIDPAILGRDLAPPLAW